MSDDMKLVRVRAGESTALELERAALRAVAALAPPALGTVGGQLEHTDPQEYAP